MALVDMKPMITAATASAEATDRLAEAINRLAAAQEQANEHHSTALRGMGDRALLPNGGRR